MTKLWLSLVSCCLFLCTLTAFSQVQNGQFQGVVTDPTGAAIPRAKVTITNMATGLSVTTTSSQSGLYTVKELPPGAYKFTTEASGFKTREDTNVPLNAGVIQRVDFKMEIGQTREVVEVSGAATAVETEDSKLSTTINTEQIANLPLNGHNVYDLMQMAPGAVNVMGTDFENGHDTVVNGVREDFNGFTINGVSNKDISGGQNNVPIQDTVQEFQQLQLNVSAQYGSSAGSVNNLVTKSGTNALHGSAWEYVRNNDFDANEYFIKQAGAAQPPLHFNQFGVTVGGPIIKDKLFFYGAYQGDRFQESNASPILVESPEFRSAVESSNPNSVAALLYKNFAPVVSGTPFQTLNQFAPTISSAVQTATGLPAGTPDFSGWLCADNSGAAAPTMQKLIGVTAQDISIMNAEKCSTTPGIAAGAFSRTAPFLNNSVAIFGSQTQSLGNLFNGNEAEARLDYDWDSNNRTFLEFNWDHQTDKFGGNNCNANCTRGFANPNNDYFPNGQFNYVRTFSPNVLNEFKAGYTQNNTQINTNVPGVPDVTILDGVTGFGSYNGYPQYFKDHEYSYGDMVSISHGNHNLKVGADLRRNIENSVFNVARPSYGFLDPLYFAADSPGYEVAGVNPGFCTSPCSSINQNPSAALQSNFRHWRNWEVGAYVQDDWKATKRLTLNLGLRWDFYTRHSELNGQATTFKLGSGADIVQQLANANVPVGATEANGTVCNPTAAATAILAGVCGPGGYAAANSLGPNQFHDFGPRIGFAYDVFGDGKTSFRGGFGISYEGTLYNPLSNSRWNPPYYSFNQVGPLVGVSGNIIYGPTMCSGGTCGPSGAVPTFTGPATNPGQGVGAQAVGNLTGWYPQNPDLAFLTGIVLPQGIKDPYVYNEFLSIQREIAPKTIVEVDYVGTIGHRLFRSQQINRQDGDALPAGACITNNIGERECGLAGAQDGSVVNPGVPNPNYSVLRVWENANNSDYNGLQLQLKKQTSHGIMFNVNYTYSHSIDNGSSWHDAATTAAGAAGGDGYSTDVFDPRLDRGNSVFDIRQRLVINYVVQLPGQNLHSFLGAVVGGWSLDGIWAIQSGAHWSPYARNTPASLVEISNPANPCSAADVTSNNCMNVGGEWTLDNQFPGVDRPNSSVANFQQNRASWGNGWCPSGFSFFSGSAPGASSCGGAPSQSGLPTFSAPCLGCVGSLGRNQFVGPGLWSTDMTLAKNFKLTERLNLKFEASAFNIFNRANFILASFGGGANNSLDNPQFGKAGGTLNARNLQLGLKLAF
jgi:outer membrane receptor for ferrienterochelin and colicin